VWAQIVGSERGTMTSAGLTGAALALLCGVMLSVPPQRAAACGGAYTVERGDALTVIANRLYKDARKWEAIFDANRTIIGDNPDQIEAGDTYQLPCIDGRPERLGGRETPTQSADAGTGVTEPHFIQFLTADDYAPFSGRGLMGQGMIVELVEAMLAATPDMSGSINWVNDRESHLAPLLSDGHFDASFPWTRPDCTSEGACAGLLYSAPMFEMLELLFVRSDDARRAMAGNFRTAAICRPEGLPIHDLDAWGAEGPLIREETTAACFDALLDGRVDAVSVNEFTGRLVVAQLGVASRVIGLDRDPISIETLHVVVDPKHQHAEDMLAKINTGLAAVRADGTFQEVLDRHLQATWGAF